MHIQMLIYNTFARLEDFVLCFEGKNTHKELS